MLNIKVWDNAESLKLIYDFSLFNKLSLIIGDSGTGKTLLFDIVNSVNNKRDLWKYECFDTSIKSNIKMLAALSLENLRELSERNSNTLIIVDEDVAVDARCENFNYDKYNNYYLIFHRRDIIKYDTNVMAVYEFNVHREDGHELRTLKQFFTLAGYTVSDNNISKFNCMLTEDTASGLVFWKSVLSKVAVLDYKISGSGGLPRSIETALNEHDGNLIVALDYDRGSRVMYEIIYNSNIDHSRVYFIPLESFEEIVCNSEFILSKFPDLRVCGQL